VRCCDFGDERFWTRFRLVVTTLEGRFPPRPLRCRPRSSTTSPLHYAVLPGPIGARSGPPPRYGVRVNEDIKGRTNVGGEFPNGASASRLVGAVLAEVHGDWQVAEQRRCLSEGAMAELTTPPTGEIDIADTYGLPAA
jgi:hypothetical protein